MRSRLVIAKADVSDPNNEFLEEKYKLLGKLYR